MIRLTHTYLFFSLLLSVLASSGLRAQSGEETIPDGYLKDYVFLQALRDEPLMRSRDLFENAGVGYALKYVHRLESDWIVGLRAGRKPLLRDDGRPLSLIVFSNQTQGIWRLYHPLYILAGTEVSYIMPAQKAAPPFAKYPDLDTEIGVGLNTSLWYFVSKKGIVEFQISRWRGTKTNSLHGFEVSLAYGFGF